MEPKTLQDAILFFSDPANCREYLVARRWPDRGKLDDTSRIDIGISNTVVTGSSSAPGSTRRRRGEFDGWTPLVPTLPNLHRRACSVKGSQTAAGGAETRKARRASMASVLDGA